MKSSHGEIRGVGLSDVDVAIFDWDGTIIDSVQPKVLQNQALAAEFGHDLTLDEVRVIWNSAIGFPDLMQKLCLTDDMDAIMDVVKRDYDKPEFAKRSFEFGDRTIRLIREMGKRTALITNVTREILNLDTSSLGFTPIDTYFDFTQTADESEHKKPDPRVFTNLLTELSVEPSRVIYVGDELKDFYAARDAGIRFIGVETGMATREEFQKQGAETIIQSIETLVR